MEPRQTIEAFDRYLVGLGLRFEAIVIGGSALGLMGIIQRPTRPRARTACGHRCCGTRIREGAA